ncbi:hypothetical protein PINS_up023856 [Pythium insidiosum]|nr:hypothetical protein PINS_up016548 [Pythium insidiosum]GLE11440.1 hypothetical protein PINS_up023856 [Pythium insidiosum]
MDVADIHWRELKTFVHARYPPQCTDDLQGRKLEHSGNYGPFVVPPNVPDDLNGYYFIKERHYGTLTVRGLLILVTTWTDRGLL